MGKNKSHRARKRKQRLSHPCGCFFCCGNPDKEQRVRYLKIPKHKKKNWQDF